MSHISNFWLNDIQTNNESNVDCCGCSACYNICTKNAIIMKYDEEGFLYPVVNESVCNNCGLCTRICPILNKSQENQYISVYGGYSSDNLILQNSTSGGIISEISKFIIQNKGTVFGVKYSQDYVKAEYSVARTSEELSAFAYSKYVQSEKNNIFQQVKSELNNNKQVLFVGCPCDVAALKLYLGKDKDNLITCEVVCMGVTSYKIAEDYKKWSEKKNESKIIFINARSKKKGWFVPHLEEHFENGKIKCSTLFGTYYGYGFQIFNRPSCLKCQYRGKVGEGDIRVGDYWGIKKTDLFWNPMGVSSIFVRTRKGLNIINKLKNNRIILYDSDYETATLSNMSSYKNKSQKFIDLRSKFAQIYIKEGKGLVTACHCTATISFWIKHYIPDEFHNFLKRIYHVIYDKR